MSLNQIYLKTSSSHFYFLGLSGLCGGVLWIFCLGGKELFGIHRHFAVWWLVPHCVMWCLWRERNARHFEDCESTIPELKLLFFQTLYEWVLALGSLSFLPGGDNESLCFLSFLLAAPQYTPSILGLLV